MIIFKLKISIATDKIRIANLKNIMRLQKNFMTTYFKKPLGLLITPWTHLILPDMIFFELILTFMWSNRIWSWLNKWRIIYMLQVIDLTYVY